MVVETDGNTVVREWQFEPIVRTYPHPEGHCIVVLASKYSQSCDVIDRIALMLATAMPGVEVSLVRDEPSHLTIRPAKYHQPKLGYNETALNEMLRKWLGSPVVGLERHPTLPLVWLLMFNGVNLHHDHVAALKRIGAVQGVAVENAVVYDGQAALLYVPSLGVRSDNDAGVSRTLLEDIRRIFDFTFVPASNPAEPAEPINS